MNAAALSRAGVLALLLAAAPQALAQAESGDEGSDAAPVDTIPVNVRDEESAVQRGDAPEEERKAVLFATVGLSHVSSPFANVEDAVNMDVSLGAGLPWPYLDWFGAEIALAFTVVPGEYRGARPCEETGALPPLSPGEVACAAGFYTRSQNELQMTNLGAFGVLRTPGRFYALGKYGWRYIASSIDEIQEGDRDGPAWAAGAGWRFGYGRLTGLELSYSDYSEQLEMVTLALTHGFGAAPDEPSR
jgi:hypothetical protein